MAQLDQKKSPQEKKPQASLPTVQEMGGPPDSNTVVDKIDEALGGRVRVTHGANDCEFDNLAGKTVASVRKALSSVFSIPKEAQPYIKGEVVAEDRKLQQGEQLEFLKQSGTKG